MAKVFILFCACLVIFCVTVGICLAQIEPVSKDTEGKVVTEIEVKNNRAISTATILAKVKTAKGKPFSQTILNQDLKGLYATDFFTDISIDVQDFEGGIKVIFVVTEKPIVDAVGFEGNKAIREEKLLEVVKTKANQMLNYRTLKSDTEEVLGLYEKNGFHLAKINYDIDLNQQTNRARVTFKVTETERVRIKRIFVEGNRAFKDNKILGLLSTRRDTLFTSGFFKKDEFEADLRKIEDFYKKEGFIDVKVDSQLDYDSTGKNLYITIKIDEGKKYYVGNINIVGNKVFPEFKLRSQLEMLPHSVFSQEDLKGDVVKLQEYYFNDGYIQARAKADTVLNDKTGDIDIVYNITEGEVAYVERIDVRGNDKTKDIVIRRELRIYPGEKFDGGQLKRSKERLYNMGYFEEINYDIEPGSEANKKNLVVTVKETKTGEFSFGAGYSSIDQLLGFVDITQKNFDLFNWPTFTGDGQCLRLHSEFGTIRRDYELGFTEPWIFDYPVLFGFDVYQRTHAREKDVGYGYDEERRGGDIRLGKELGEYNRADLIYMLENVDISDVAENASSDLKLEEGSNRISSLGLRLTHDTRDNVHNPSEGLLGIATADYTGGFLGGDINFLRYTFGGSLFLKHFKKNVLELKAKAGAVDDFDTSRIPIYERFFAGGANTIRGYKERRVGPRDPNTEDPIGGKSIVLATAEYTFPIVKVLKAAAFFDTGNVWPTVGEFASGNFKSGTGVGARIKTPLGPVKLDYGFPLDSITGEKKRGRFHFSMTRGF